MDTKGHPDHEDAGSDGQAELLARREAFGDRMRALREEQAVSLDALAATTRIGITFLEAIEAGKLDKLPGRVFGRGFVQSIAKNFGADPEPLLVAYADLWEQAPPRSVLKVQIKNKPVRQRSDGWVRMTATASSLVRRGILVKIVAPVAALVGLLYVLVSRPQVRQIFQNLRGSGATIAAVKAKPLDLRIRPEPTAGEGPKPAKEASLAPVASLTAGAITTAAGSAAAPSGITPETAPAPALIEHSRWSATPAATASIPSNPIDTSLPETTEKADHLQLPISAAGDQVLVLTVTEPVRIRLDVDHGQSVTKELVPDTYRFTFSQKADVMIYDAAAVKISFNGRPIGALGGKGRVRRLSFQSPAQSSKTF